MCNVSLNLPPHWDKNMCCYVRRFFHCHVFLFFFESETVFYGANLDSMYGVYVCFMYHRHLFSPPVELCSSHYAWVPKNTFYASSFLSFLSSDQKSNKIIKKNSLCFESWFWFLLSFGYHCDDEERYIREVNS